MVILSVLALLLIALAVWFVPANVIWPWYFWTAVVGGVAFFALRWVLRLPWKLVVDTQGHYNDDSDSETWVGTVRGVAKAREEVRLITRALRKEDSPEYIGGILKRRT